MFKNLRIRNFRAFDDLEIPRLGLVNLVTGKNNTGKTSLLEALFLLCGAGNPEMALRINAIRGIDWAQGPTVPETLWKPTFADFDMTRTVEIEGNYTSYGPLRLRIVLDQPNTIQLPFDIPDRTLAAGYPNESELKFSFKKGSENRVESRIRLAGEGFQIDPAVSPLPFLAVLLSSRSGNLREGRSASGAASTTKAGGSRGQCSAKRRTEAANLRSQLRFRGTHDLG